MTKTAHNHAKTHRTHLLEQCYGESSPNVDREAGVIRDVKVLGSVSKNGREYSQKAQKDACTILEGISVNIDHNRDNPKRERGFMESVGTLNGLYLKPDGVYAKEFRVKKTHPYAPVIFESAESFPKNFGLSINAEGEVGKVRGRWVVESIVTAQSVDVVGKPATTSGIFESESESESKSADAGKVRTVKITVKKLIEQHGTAEQKTRLAKLLEGDSAMMEQPIEVDEMPAADELEEGEGEESEYGPMDQINDAFVALVASVMADSTLDLKSKIEQVTTILTTQDQLLNGTADMSTMDAEIDTMTEGYAATKAMTESINALRKTLEESTKRQASTDARLLLVESNRKPLAERITALVQAKDDAARTALIESWPAERVAAKPRQSAPLFESRDQDYPTEFPTGKAFLSKIRN
jgi:hypothetical protein